MKEGAPVVASETGGAAMSGGGETAPGGFGADGSASPTLGALPDRGGPAAVNGVSPHPAAGAAGGEPTRDPRAVAPPGRPMAVTSKHLVGCWLLVLTIVSLAHLLWAWSIATRLTGASGSPPAISVHWLWLRFSPSPQFSLLLVVTLSAVVGSFATMSLIFGNRAGHRTLEEDWEWWYVLRPGAVAVIGVLAYVIVVAGFLSTTGKADSLASAAAIGALAGLFTDRVLAAMRSALGASAFNTSASNPEEAKKTGGTDAGALHGASDGAQARPVPVTSNAA